MNISEWVSVGHPDKLADLISEYILDRHLEQDPHTRYAVEVQVKGNDVTLAGEITSEAKVDLFCATVAAIRIAGYTNEYLEEWGVQNAINPNNIVVRNLIDKQSPEIAEGVNNGGWGDQGIMFGMATNTEEFENIPKDYYMARKIGRILYKNHKYYNIGIDIKTQVVENEEKEITKVIVAAPMKPEKEQDAKRKIKELINKYCPKAEIIINGTGIYVKHSSIADCGTTGRKLAVDFYGGNCKIGGGSPWTKDGTKADLTLNLYARYKALEYIKQHPKNNAVYVSIGCCIGKPEIDITIKDENNKTIKSYTETVTPKELIDLFELKKAKFTEMAKEGLFYNVDKLF